MSKPSYMVGGVDASLARLVKDGAIFVRDAGTADIPTNENWTPSDADTQIGYYSEDGFTLTPAPGDTTELNGHNGDPLVAESAPGWWTVAFAGLEGNEVTTQTYFDVDANPDGSITVTSAAANKRYDIVTVGLDQNDRVILVHYPNVQISEREGITFNRTTLLAMGATFRTFKGGSNSPYMFKAWGLTADASPVTSENWTSQVTGVPTGGSFRLIVDGFPTSELAFDAANGVYDTAINGLSGVTGVTVTTTGTGTKALAFSGSVNVQANAGGLTGGTSPAVVVTKV